MTKENQQQIFKEWLDVYKALLFKIVRVYAGSEMDRGDLFQEISIQVWRSIPAFRHACSVSTWLYRIALNTALKWSEKERRINKTKESIESANNISIQAGSSDERLEWLYNEISLLDEIDRSIALLLLDGYSYKEMSAILGISENHVGVKINRIKKHLITKSKNHSDHAV